VFANYLIGLREGLEASLVVSILVAYLVRTSRHGAVRWVWLGVGAAVAMSISVVGLLELTASSLSDEAAELFAGITSLVAVVFVTWMIFWMRSASRTISAELRDRVDAAVGAGVGAVVAMAFIAVAREGLETALFFFAAARAAGSTAQPLVGFLLGLATAVLLGWLLYRRAITIDLGRFFRVTGVLLVFVAAGVLSYGIHELQEVGVLPGAENLAFDASAILPEGSWYAALLSGTLNITAETTVLQAVAWTLYVAITLTVFLRPVRGPVRGAAPAEAAQVRA
jgi:high-affinity iron transporter